MIGVVIVAHGEQAGVQLRVAKTLVPGLEGVVAVDLPVGEDLEKIRARIRAAIEEVREDDGVLLLADLFGSTPASCALSFAVEGEVEVVTGFNLPMLLRLETCRRGGQELAGVAAELVAYGQRNIVHASAPGGRERSLLASTAAEQAGHGEGEVHEGRFRIVNRLGLHARAAAKLVQLANQFPCEISLRKDEEAANAKSIMGVLMLAAAQGSEILVRAEGEEAAQALQAVGGLIADGFGEDRGE